MDLETLKKKLSTFKTDGGKLRNVSDDLLMEILTAWENWSGPAKDFYTSIGTNHKKFGSLLGKAKKLKREGYVLSGEFEEIKMTESSECKIELVWSNDKIIRFSEVDLVVDFLKKVA